MLTSVSPANSAALVQSDQPCHRSTLHAAASNAGPPQLPNTAYRPQLPTAHGPMQVDPDYDKMEKEFKAISREILGEEEVSEDGEPKEDLGGCLWGVKPGKL